jgi:hypothetical protein
MRLMQTIVQGTFCTEPIFCAKQAVSLLWEARGLLVLAMAPGGLVFSLPSFFSFPSPLSECR